MGKLKDLYRQIWDERPRVCKVCGYPISTPLAHVFSHVYSKGAHPELKYERRNIELWCSTLIRSDGNRGCHELSHENPEAFTKRAKDFGYKKPTIREILEVN